MNSRNAYSCNHTEHISRYQRSAYSAIFQQQIKTNDNSQSHLNPQTIMTNNFSLINSYLRISGCRALQIFSRFIKKLQNALIYCYIFEIQAYSFLLVYMKNYTSGYFISLICSSDSQASAGKNDVHNFKLMTEFHFSKKQQKCKKTINDKFVKSAYI